MSYDLAKEKTNKLKRRYGSNNMSRLEKKFIAKIPPCVITRESVWTGLKANRKKNYVKYELL